MSLSGPYLIDAPGVVYREEGPLRYPTLPSIPGWSDLGSRSAQVRALHRALRILAALGAEGVRVSELHIDRDRDLDRALEEDQGSLFV